MKRVATEAEHPPVVAVPEAAGVAVAGVQPPLAVIAPADIEHTEAAARVSYVYDAIYATAS